MKAIAAVEVNLLYLKSRPVFIFSLVKMVIWSNWLGNKYTVGTNIYYKSIKVGLADKRLLKKIKSDVKNKKKDYKVKNTNTL